MKLIAAKTVDEYIKAAPKEMQSFLSDVRKTIKAAAPKAEELISYQMPGYKYSGYQLVYFAAFSNHLSLFPGSKSILKTFEKELKPFKASGGTIQFTVDNPLPLSLVKKIVKERMKQNEERALAKTKKSSAKSK